jgi:hypothetical protein
MERIRRRIARRLPARLVHGADRNARSKSGKTAAEIGRTHAGIVRLLSK